VAARIVAKVSAGLHAAHELEDDDGVRMHVVHRDVSPQNILISKSGQVKVTDFGVAKAKGQRHRGSATGELKGKISYVAPEQITSLEVDHRADIFALGCVLYEATVGVEPFRAEGSLSTPYQLLARDVATPQTLVHGYPEELASIVVKALARDPKDRFQTAEAFGVAIETWLARSHGIVTEQTIADLVTETVGTFVEEKSRRIEQAIAKITLPMTPDLNALRSLPVRSTGRGAAASAAPQRVAIVSETGTPPLMTSEPEGAARPTVPARPSARKPASR
jgi:serine/threonine-protein kinase